MGLACCCWKRQKTSKLPRTKRILDIKGGCVGSWKECLRMAREEEVVLKEKQKVMNLKGEERCGTFSFPFNSSLHCQVYIK